MLEKLKKLRGRSAGELRERCAQKVAALRERRGRSELARLPGDEEFSGLLDAHHASNERAGRALDAASLLESFRARTSPRFFPSFDDREATIAEWRRRRPSSQAQLVERAERILRGRFDLLGHRDLFFGLPVDWHLEPVAGVRAPLHHWSRIEEVGAKETGDKKIIWELNRHQHFVTLGRAYWATGEERYAETFAEHLASWMEANPPKLGVNWLSSLEVAFRSISWLWALHFFRDSRRLTPALYVRALKFLYLHARHVETYLSTYSSPNTHLTGEALGLYYLGLLLPEFKRAPFWRETGERILLSELDRHVRPDGVYFEQSSYYHRYTTDFYTHLSALKAANGERIPEKLGASLASLLDHLMYLTRPDGTTPLFGDDDGGKLLKFDEREAADFRPALSNGAALFGRGDYKFVASEAAEETLWLFGPEGLRAFDETTAREPSHASRAFTDGGYYVMRDGWRRDADYLLIDCGPHGTLNCGHAHADALALDLSARGRTLLVDAGTYTYTGSDEMRDLFRSTAAHSTLTVDGESSSVPHGPFSWRHVARTTPREWITNARFDFFDGEHDGYRRFDDPVTHQRSVLFVKGSYWIVLDRARARAAHRYDLRFHFAPEAEPSIEDDGPEGSFVAEENGAHAGLDVFTFGPEGAWRRESGWVSGCYGERLAAHVLAYEAEGAGACEFVTFLIPRCAGRARARVRVIEKETGARAFEVNAGDTRDVLMLGGGRLNGELSLDSDFDWTWARWGREGAGPQELILIGGRSLVLNNRAVLSAGRRLTHARVSRDRDRLRIETARGEEASMPDEFAEREAEGVGVEASV